MAGTAKHRLNSGLTLVELLVVVVVIGVLAATALPNFFGASSKAKEAGVKINAHTCHVAVESWATDNDGAYPSEVSQFVYYLSGGDGPAGAIPGDQLRNPFNNTTAYPTNGAAAATQGEIGYQNNLPTPGAYTVTGFGQSEVIITLTP